MLMVAMVTTAMAGDIVASTNEASPEKIFTMVSGNNASVGADAAPGDGRFAFFAVENVENAYYIYSVTNNKWFSYAKADSYSNGAGFVTLSDTKENYFHFEKIDNGYYQIRPYNNSGVAAKYLNYYGGASAGVKLGLWQDIGNSDAGSRYLIEEYVELVTVNALADFNPNKYYTVSTSSRGGWSVGQTSERFESTADGGLGTTVDPTNTRNQFAVLSVDGENYYLFSVHANKFIKADRTMVAGVADAITLTDASSQGEGRVRVNFKDVANHYINLGGSNQMAIDSWGTIDAGNAVLFVERGDFDPTEALAMLSNVAEVTYNFVCNGVTLATQTATVSKGSEYPAFNVTLPLGYEITEQKPEGTVDANHTEEITVVVNNELLPFNAVAEGTPTTWYYAQMHAHGSYHWFVAPAEDGSIATADHKFAASEVEAHLWGFVGTVEAGFKMVNKATGEAIKSTNSGVAGMAVVADATAFIAMGSQAGGNYFCLRYPQGNYLNSQSNVINHWGANDNGSSFLLTEYVDEDVTVNVSEAGWATKYFAESVHVPAGVNAYIVTGAESGWITKSQIAEGEVIPANTGILLENAGEHKFAKTVTYKYTLAGNLLNGSVENTYVEGTAYVLANGKNGVGFYKAELNKNATGGEGDTHFLNNAGKAYFKLPASENSAAFYGFDWAGTTGIENIVVENEVKAIYDLTGRKVETISAPGIYIIGGKKTLVK